MTTDTPRARVASAMPGRLRIRLDRAHRGNGALDRVEESLEARDGIDAVAASSTTGSVLVHYDPRALGHDDVLAMLRDAGIVIGEVARSVTSEEDIGHSVISTRILDVLTDLDRRLSRATNGVVDIKLLFPLTLGTLAIRQIATSGLGLSTVPGYVLLWYTFDSFYKLHPRVHPPLARALDGQAAEKAGAADADARAAHGDPGASGSGQAARTARGAGAGPGTRSRRTQRPR